MTVIVHGSEERGVELGEATGFESVTGKGVRGHVDGQAVALGNLALMTQLKIELEDQSMLRLKTTEQRRLLERERDELGKGLERWFERIDGR